MAKYIFPAIFEPNELGGYCVYFPDVECVCTQGKDLKHAMDMAEDALCLMLHDMEKSGDVIPEASKPGDIKAKPDDIINLVACDTKFYEHYFTNKSVKMNVTIPLWLKEKGEKNHVDFSQILQDGVKEYLHLN